MSKSLDQIMLSSEGLDSLDNLQPGNAGSLAHMGAPQKPMQTSGALSSEVEGIASLSPGAQVAQGFTWSATSNQTGGLPLPSELASQHAVLPSSEQPNINSSLNSSEQIFGLSFVGFEQAHLNLAVVARSASYSKDCSKTEYQNLDLATTLATLSSELITLPPAELDAMNSDDLDLLDELLPPIDDAFNADWVRAVGLPYLGQAGKVHCQYCSTATAPKPAATAGHAPR